MKLIKKILPIFILLIAILTIVSCKKNNSSTSYSYPNPVPLYNSEDTYLTVGNLKVSKKSVYNRLLNSYGKETLKNLLDDKLLPALSTEDQAEFDLYLDNLIYGSDKESLSPEELNEKLDSFKNAALTLGLKIDDSEKDDSLYYVNYYKLQYRREVYALKKLAEEIKASLDNEDTEDDKLTDNDYVSFVNSNFHKHYNLVLVTFESRQQALDALKAAGVKTENLVAEWTNASDTKLTKDEIKNVFLSMYQATTNKTGEVTSYTYNELCKVAATSTQDKTIANRVAKLSTEELTNAYTHAPAAYSGRWFLAFLDSTSDEYFLDSNPAKTLAASAVKEFNADGTVKELTDEAKTELFDLVVKNQLNSSTSNHDNNVTRYLNELRQSKNLEIFSEAIEIPYKTDYESAYSSLSITDYASFKETTNTSSDVVAKTDELSISVEDMYKALTDQYGVLLSLLFVQQYVLLNSEYNKVIDYATLEVKDQEKYNTYVTADYTTYKEAFESGNFEANGYPAAYGWENFMRDYLGVTSEKEIVTDFNGTLYDDVLALYTEAIYLAEVGDVELVLPDGADDYALTSPKWERNYGVLAKDSVKEGTTPTISLAMSKDDIKNVAKKHDTDDKEIEYKPEDYYGHFLVTYTNTEGNEVTIITDVEKDQAVLEKMAEIYNASFTATVSSVYAYVDNNHDGVADNIDDNDELKNKAKELVNLVWNQAYYKYSQEVADKTYPRQSASDYIAAAVRAYATSNDPMWETYKQAGFRLGTTTGTSYSRTTDASDELKATVKTMWADLKNMSSSVMGQTIDPIYRWVENDVVHNVKAMEFADHYEAVYSKNAYYRLVVTKATSITAYTYTSTTISQTPNYYLYTQYKLDTDKRETNVYCSSQFTSYYTPAISELASSSIANKKLLEDAKALLASVTFSSNNDANIAQLTKVIDATLDAYN